MFLKKTKNFDENQTNDSIEKLFMFRMPSDFFKFWQFCYELNSSNPKGALIDLNLELVGAFDVLQGKIKESLAESDPEKAICYYRYYFDPPEMQTVISHKKTKYHIGYLRDSPKEPPCLLVSNDPDKNCRLEEMGDNLFSSLVTYCSNLKTKSDSKTKSKIDDILKKLTTFSEKHGIELENHKMIERRKKINSKTFHGAGIVVPVENDIGYRPLSKSDSDLKKLLAKIVEKPNEREKTAEYKQLQELIRFANIANDECDFGQSLELGLDLFCFGDEFFHKHCLAVLSSAYDLLERSEFYAILQIHLTRRSKAITN